VEKLVLDGTTIVRWPNGTGFIRHSDGTGAEIKADGEMAPADGTIEILPKGAVRQTLPTGTKVDMQPDGTKVQTVSSGQSNPEFQPSSTAGRVSGDLGQIPRGQILLETRLAVGAWSCKADLVGAVMQIDANTAGVPRPSADVAKVEEKQRGMFDYLGPAIGTGIGIFGGSRGGGSKGSGDSGPWAPKRFLP
jgi:hypothetical protein